MRVASEAEALSLRDGISKRFAAADNVSKRLWRVETSKKKGTIWMGEWSICGSNKDARAMLKAAQYGRLRRGERITYNPWNGKPVKPKTLYWEFEIEWESKSVILDFDEIKLIQKALKADPNAKTLLAKLKS